MTLKIQLEYIKNMDMVGIAQLVRASDCDSEGRRFESGYPPHTKFKAHNKSPRFYESRAFVICL